jgi:hypothetical protein
VQALENDRGAVLELGQHSLDVRRARERRRPPREIRRVRRDVELRAGLGEAKPRKAERAGREKPLDVGDGEEVVEATLLGPGDDERLLLPVAVEELLDGDRMERSG